MLANGYVLVIHKVDKQEGWVSINIGNDRLLLNKMKINLNDASNPFCVACLDGVPVYSGEFINEIKRVLLDIIEEDWDQMKIPAIHEYDLS